MTSPKRSAKQTANLIAALSVVAHGYVVVPFGPNKRPAFHGRRKTEKDENGRTESIPPEGPMDWNRSWSEDGLTTTEQVEAYWGEHPNALPGTFLPADGDRTVLDVEGLNGHDVDGRIVIEALERSLDLSRFPRIRTPSGGFHLHGCRPDHLRGQSLYVGDGVEVFGLGGNQKAILLPPAHVKAGVYVLEAPFVFEDLFDLPEFPPEMFSTPPDRVEQPRHNQLRSDALRMASAGECVNAIFERLKTRRTFEKWDDKPDDELQRLAQWAVEKASPGPRPEPPPVDLPPRIAGNGTKQDPPQGVTRPEAFYIDPDEDLSQARFAIKPILPAGGVALLGGLPKTGKTSLGFSIAAESLRGEDPVPGAFTLGETPPTKVLVLSEMSDYQAKRMFTLLYDPGRDLAGRVAFFDKSVPGVMTDPRQLQASILELVERERFDLVIVDTLARWCLAGDGESLNDQTTAQRTMDVFRNVADQTGASVLVLAHNRKDSGDTVDLNAIAGSVALRASTDANTGLRLVSEETTVIEVRAESRDVDWMLYLARKADALGLGLPTPEPPMGSGTHWHLRMGTLNGRVVYRKAEDHLVPDSGSFGPKANREDVRESVTHGLLRLHQDQDRCTDPVHAFSSMDITAAAKVEFKGHGDPPGRGTVEAVLADLALQKKAFHVKQGTYPGHPRRGGWSMASFWARTTGEDRGT